MLKDPNLLKRPVIIKGKKKLTGFNEAERQRTSAALNLAPRG